MYASNELSSNGSCSAGATIHLILSIYFFTFFPSLIISSLGSHTVIILLPSNLLRILLAISPVPPATSTIFISFFGESQSIKSSFQYL